MLVSIIKGFPYSWDGVTELKAVAGTTCDVPDQHIEGLVAEGYIHSPVDPNAVVDIPENWPSLKWFGLKALAEKIAGKEVAKAPEAKSIIEQELARRAI